MCPKLISSFGVTIKGETMKGIFSNPAEKKLKIHIDVKKNSKKKDFSAKI